MIDVQTFSKFEVDVRLWRWMAFVLRGEGGAKSGRIVCVSVEARVEVLRQQCDARRAREDGMD